MPTRILALLEHQELLKLIAESLEHSRHQIYKFAESSQAMDLLRKHDVDLIIADVHLQMGGNIFDFIRWIKGDPHFHKIPFFCFSTEPVEVAEYLEDAVRTAARSMGATRYITMAKFDPAFFRQEIEWLLPQDRAKNSHSEPAATLLDMCCN